MSKDIPLSGGISLILSICSIIGGVYFLISEIMSNHFVLLQSKGILFLSLGIGLFFTFRFQVLDAKK
ncbi:hypothetical protein ACFSKI_06015 [Pseudogracilibacillus auburnensis]|uniref:Uncharacterized protein n=1 Tax=Pseudogracilibacillus auburnensis TaxID=1494959 RepID=A0A2V3W0N2_9BACI|nr:hypothetical protein [Pseudogracilibacillus auburnensis]MBO1002136.1 hypothetical protein [Pseudogracilibacillus auburnensis]PXW87460.1 hypothetical protein DFR56_105102 [Pseudogracilibacillus auburnensis]